MAVAACKLSDSSNVFNFVAPTGGVTVNIPIKIQNSLVMPLVTAAAGVTFVGLSLGSGKLLTGATKKTGAAWTVGQRLYWDATNGFATTSTGNTDFGALGLQISAAAAAVSGDTTGTVAFN